MATRELQSNEGHSLFDGWWVPFLWIVMSPLITVPVSGLLIAVSLKGSSDVGLPKSADWCLCTFAYGDVTTVIAIFVLPGVLNLVPWIYAFSAQRRVRVAAVFAGALGLLRLALPPVVLILAFDRFAGSDGRTYFQFKDSVDGIEPYLTVWFFGALAWIVTVVAWAVFGLVTRKWDERSSRELGAATSAAVSVEAEVQGAEAWNRGGAHDDR